MTTTRLVGCWLMAMAIAACSSDDSSGGGATSGGGGSGEAGAAGSAQGGGSGSGGGAAASPALTACLAACEKADAAGCSAPKPGDCAALCEHAGKVASCAKVFGTYGECIGGADWSCGPGGAATPSKCSSEAQSLAACLGSAGNGTGDLKSAGSFWCDSTVCSGGVGEKACCLKIDTAALKVVSSCAASIDACGQDSRWECDGPEDCGGKACCWSNPSTGMGQIVIGLCKDMCQPFAGEKETCNVNGSGTCTGGQFCCQQPGDDVGECVAAMADCKPKMQGGETGP